jgi:hypothetical protein
VDFIYSSSLTHSNDAISKSLTIVADTKDVFGDADSPIAVAAGATVNISLNVDPDLLIAYFILVSVAMTLTTTNTSGGADVINILANEPLAWHNKMQIANGHFANRNPWTNLAFHNAGSSDGTLRVMIARDGTS